VIDIGANYGYYTILFGALVGEAGHVYSVEPNPAALSKLHRSVDLNGLASRTTIVPAAAGAADGGEVLLYVPDGEPKNARIVPTSEPGSADAGAVHVVPRVTIDRCAAAAQRIDFVKIDVEGAEEAVVAGMTQILMRDKPGLVLEFNAARCCDAGGFIARLRQIYGRICYIDFDGEVVEASTERLLTEQFGHDWLLYLDDPPVLAPA
jgi:FkbM family methyltransferase